MEKWKLDLLNIENAGTITESERDEIIIHARKTVDATFKNIHDRYSVNEYNEVIKGLFYCMMQPYVVFHGKLDLDDLEKKRIYNSLALHNKVRLIELLGQLVKLPEHIYRNRGKEDVERIISWIKKSIEILYSACYIFKDGRMYTSNMYLPQIEKCINELEIEYMPEKIKLQQDLRTNKNQLGGSEKEFKSFEEIANEINKFPTEHEISEENLNSLNNVENWIIKNVSEDRKANLDRLKMLKSDLLGWQPIFIKFKDKPLHSIPNLEEKRQKSIRRFEAILEAALKDLNHRIDRKQDILIETKAQNTKTKISTKNQISYKWQGKGSELNEFYNDVKGKLIDNDTKQKDFCEIFVAFPLEKLKSLKWISNNATELLYFIHLMMEAGLIKKERMNNIRLKACFCKSDGSQITGNFKELYHRIKRGYAPERKEIITLINTYK